QGSVGHSHRARHPQKPDGQGGSPRPGGDVRQLTISRWRHLPISLCLRSTEEANPGALRPPEQAYPGCGQLAGHVAISQSEPGEAWERTTTVTAASSFEAQRLDSSRHAEAPRPMRDTSIQPSVDEILAATAHELRLPLSHIKGFVSSLRRSDIEWDDETRSDFLAEIDLETDRLAQLVEELCTTQNAAERGLAARGPDGSYGPG